MLVILAPLRYDGVDISSGEMVALARDIRQSISGYPTPYIGNTVICFVDPSLEQASNMLAYNLDITEGSIQTTGNGIQPAEKTVESIKSFLNLNKKKFVIFGVDDEFRKSFPKEYCRIQGIPITDDEMSYLDGTFAKKGNATIMEPIAPIVTFTTTKPIAGEASFQSPW